MYHSPHYMETPYHIKVLEIIMPFTWCKQVMAYKNCSKLKGYVRMEGTVQHQQRDMGCGHQFPHQHRTWNAATNSHIFLHVGSRILCLSPFLHTPFHLEHFFILSYFLLEGITQKNRDRYAIPKQDYTLKLHKSLLLLQAAFSFASQIRHHHPVRKKIIKNWENQLCQG